MFGLFTTLLAVALARTVIAWWNAPASVSKDGDTGFPEYLPYALGMAAVIFLLSLLRKAVASPNSAPLQTRAASLFSRIRFTAPNGIRWLTGFNSLALLIGAIADLPRTGYNLIHAIVFVSSLTIIYMMERSRHPLWLSGLGLLAVLYCPAIHLVSGRSTWVTVDWLAAILLAVLFMIMVTARGQVSRLEEIRIGKWKYEGAVIVVRLRQYAGQQIWEPWVSLESPDGTSIELGTPFDDSIFKSEDKAYSIGLAYGRKCVDDALADQE